MTSLWYVSEGKAKIMANPQNYAWNCVLCFIQFTQAEILQMKAYVDICTLVRYQKAVTQEFLHTNFAEEIDGCLELEWNDINKYVKE
jgi:hypothetical protein